MTVENKLRVRFGYTWDESSYDSPLDWSGAKLDSFNRNHVNYCTPSHYRFCFDEHGDLRWEDLDELKAEEFVAGGVDPDDYIDADAEELREAIENSTAFFCSYYEHGNCVWSLEGEGPQCRWDSTRIAGILWLGPDDVEETEKIEDLAERYAKRVEIARSLLALYTDWCNGNVYTIVGPYVWNEETETWEDYEPEQSDFGPFGGFNSLGGIYLTGESDYEEALRRVAEGHFELPPGVTWGEVEFVEMQHRQTTHLAFAE